MIPVGKAFFRIRSGLAPLLLAGLLLMLMAPDSSQARPEKIRPGVSYYSDDFETRGGISDLAGEKNLEEVYQFFRYYEAIYDKSGRVIDFRVYKQGSLERRETYAYSADGKSVVRIIHSGSGQKERKVLSIGK